MLKRVTPDIVKYVVVPSVGLSSIIEDFEYISTSNYWEIDEDFPENIDSIHYQHPELMSLWVGTYGMALEYVEAPSSSDVLEALDNNSQSFQFILMA